MKSIVVIPARLESSRLPNKVLLDLGGKSIIQRVYEQCKKAPNIDEVFIATDNSKIQDTCSKFTNNIIITSKEHNSGTERISQAIQEINSQVVVNVQGDEPFIDPELIGNLAKTTLESSASMCSAMQRIHTVSDLIDPNVVKVVVNQQNMAIYFSRSPIPYPRENYDKMLQDKVLPTQMPFYKHIGIYGYKRDFLLNYSSLPLSRLEQTEKLEQLRVLDAGKSIEMITTTHEAFGIDTPQDYQNALKKIKGTTDEQ